MPKHTKRSRPRASSARFLSRAKLRQVATCLRGPPRDSGIAGDRWSIARVHRLLRKRFGLDLSPRYSIRRLRRAGVRVKLIRAREPRLSRSALARLQRALRRPPVSAGLTGERWSRARIAELIERRWRVRVTPAHAGRLARRLRRRGLCYARDRRLTVEQARTLRKELKHPEHAAPPAWTRAQVVSLIERRFGVRYHPQSIPGLLKRWRIAVTLTPTARGDARPSAEQRAQLATALQSPPSAAGISVPRWEQRYIAQFLHSRFGLQYPTRGLYRRVKRWGITVSSPALAGGACALTQQQRTAVAAALAQPPSHAGYSEPIWSRNLVARLILDRFNVRYACGSISHLLRREGLRLRSPPANSPVNSCPEVPETRPIDAVASPSAQLRARI
jgi:transposase